MAKNMEKSANRAMSRKADEKGTKFPNLRRVAKKKLEERKRQGFKPVPGVPECADCALMYKS